MSGIEGIVFIIAVAVAVIVYHLVIVWNQIEEIKGVLGTEKKFYGGEIITGHKFARSGDMNLANERHQKLVGALGMEYHYEHGTPDRTIYRKKK